MLGFNFNKATRRAPHSRTNRPPAPPRPLSGTRQHQNPHFTPSNRSPQPAGSPLCFWTANWLCTWFLGKAANNIFVWLWRCSNCNGYSICLTNIRGRGFRPFVRAWQRLELRGQNSAEVEEWWSSGAQLRTRNFHRAGIMRNFCLAARPV